jgi:signal transduction histidine kinase
VQEGLSNAFRHAGDDGHTVVCDLQASLLTVAVQDRGGAAKDGHVSREAGLGLTGRRARVESLGGVFANEVIPAGGTRIEMILMVMGDG